MSRVDLPAPNPAWSQWLADILQATAAGLELDHASFDAARALLEAPVRAVGPERIANLSDEPIALQAPCSSPPRSTVARDWPLSDVE